MYVGQTSRGWGATGRAPYGLQRLVWTGKVPFEAHHVSARPDGFEITFTQPVDRATASDPASYAVNSFIYKYHHIYGSPPINQLAHAVRAVEVSKDGKRARVVVDSLRQGYVHEIRMAGVRSAGGAPLLHDVGYYTVNQIPEGAKVTVRSPAPRAVRDTASSTAPVRTARRGALTKHLTTMPAEWNGAADRIVAVQAEEGLKFDVGTFDVKPGARVQLEFANPSDMLHNFVIVKPGAATKVGEAALELGLEGAKLSYVPPTDDVLYHTALLEPRKSETIYFVAPEAPGDYPFVCTFPGHYVTMQGTMRVRR
jgi:azurin